MATIKHISSKNADYGAAEAYLTFEHDEFTMKPTLDEAGRLIPRQDYRLDTLNCGEEDFALSCIRANLRYGKNSKREDIKSHHYIISFDPRDAADNGLTVDRAQALGLAYCNEHFPGHQALVCTHPDGHNHSGNIHVHIVINSLRIAEVERKPYMDRASDTRAGDKHRCTAAAMRYFRSEVMEMCHREGLYQIDLLNGSRNKVTEREYWAKRKGQAKLDKENAALLAEGIAPRQTKFETDKDHLRQTIRQALSAASFDEFSALLLREGVTVKESRGRLSYLAPDRTKPITARKLGTDFDKAAVLAVFQQNAHRAAAKTQDRQEHQPQLKKPYRERQKRIIYPLRESNRDRLCSVIDEILQQKPTDYEDFLQKLEQQGYEVKRGKYTSVKGAQQKRFIRFKTLGARYSEDEIKEVLAGKAEHRPRQKQPPKEQPFQLLVDIQSKLAEDKSGGYERWAKKHNLKEMSKTLIFLQEQKIGSADELKERADAALSHYHELGDSIKAAEQRMTEIAILHTHIINYAKTRPVYDAYRKSGYSSKFLEAHREEITLHRAAKDAFDETGLKKLPKVKELNAEYSALLTKKKALYPAYRKARDEMQEIVKAQKNVELFFAEEKDSKEKEQIR